MSNNLKPLESLQFVTTPEQVYLGQNTTVQDLIDWINYLRMEIVIKDQIIKVLNDMLRPVPDNVVDLTSNRIEESKDA